MPFSRGDCAENFQDLTERNNEANKPEHGEKPYRGPPPSASHADSLMLRASAAKFHGAGGGSTLEYALPGANIKR